jgi:hypothetical protein
VGLKGAINVQIVLRNTITRKDAVYVINAIGFSGAGGSEYWVTGHWGPWDKFILYEGTEALRHQEKYHGKCKGTLMATVRELVTQKLCNGYKVVKQYSSLPDWPICLYGQRLIKEQFYD